nr:MAG TPA: hypothetical protein [Bacteriophage sp.]
MYSYINFIIYCTGSTIYYKFFHNMFIISVNIINVLPCG